MVRPLKYKTEEERTAYLETRKQDRHKPRVQLGDRHKPRVRPGDRHKEGYQSPTRLEKFSHSEFVAWDGEGFDIQKPDESIEHVYALLMNSGGDIALNIMGLSTVECFELLLKGARMHPRAIHVCFSANYDVNMTLKDVPRYLLAKLKDGEFITWEVSPKLAYRLQWHARRKLFVGRFVTDKAQRWKNVVDGDGNVKLKRNGKPEREPQYSAKMTMWDCFGFYQCSFLRALFDNFTAEERKELGYETIVAGKARRSEFTHEELHDTIIPYCRLEVRALVLLMEKLRQGIIQMNEHLGIKVHPKRWDGSGSLSTAFMRQYKLQGVIEAAQDITPPEVEQAALHAFSAGRFETMKYGHYDLPVWAYDIKSAFLSSQVTMPDLSKGEWKHHTNSDPHIRTREAWETHETPTLFKNAQPFSLFKVSWRFDYKQPFYPFFNRGDDKEIDYPVAGLNWVWYPELLAAAETLPNMWNDVYIHEVWEFVPETDNRPFAPLQALYEWRRKLKDERNGFQLPLKFGINGTWGKTGQKVGYDEETGRIPRFHNILYSGFTTADIRAKMWRAAFPERDLIIDFSADGIKCQVPLNHLPVSNKLGEWSHTKLSGLTIVQSGVYWTHEKSETPVVDVDGKPDPCWLHGEYCAQGERTRGFNPDELTEEWVLKAWKHGMRELSVPGKRFVTLGTVVSPTYTWGGAIWSEEEQEDHWNQWRTWNRDPRKLKLMARGSKRIEHKVDKEGNPLWGKSNPSDNLIPTYPRSNPHLSPVEDWLHIFPYPDEVISRKHDVPWDDNPVGKVNISREKEMAFQVQEELDAEYQEVDF